MKERGLLHRSVGAVTFLALFSCPAAWAATYPCKLAGQDFVIQDTDRNGPGSPPDPAGAGNGLPNLTDDVLFSMEFIDDAPPPDQFEVFWQQGNGGARNSLGRFDVAIAGGVTVNGPGASGVSMSMVCGSPTYNSASVTGWMYSGSSGAGSPSVTGILVDTNNDGAVDSINLLVDVSHVGSFTFPTLTNFLFDMPIQYYPNAVNPLYVMIPDPIPAPGIPGGIPIGGAWFIPVDAVTHKMDLTCGAGLGPLTVNDAAYALAGGVCRGGAIPVIGGWGSALLVLGLFASGIWAMRRGGMGYTMALA